MNIRKYRVFFSLSILFSNALNMFMTLQYMYILRYLIF